MARMDAELEIDAGRAIVSLGGALDVSNAHRFGSLLRRLVQEGCTEIVVDLSTASAIDASGIGILRGAARAVRRRSGGRLCFKDAPDELAALLADSGLDAEAGGVTGAAARTAEGASVGVVEHTATRGRDVPSHRPQPRTTRSRVPRG